MRIVLLTERRLPDLDSDDHPYVRALAERGADVEVRVWDDDATAVACGGADLVVIRTTWDYIHRPEAFLQMVAEADRVSLVMNPLSMVRWNVDKSRYLPDLQAEGVAIVPTVWLPRIPPDPAPALATLVAGLGGAPHGVVIKPVIGAGSRDTIFVPPGHTDVGDAFIADHHPRRGLMVQPFLPRIAEGEVSLIFIGGVFSHAVKKTPQAGDFRSQSDHGGTVVGHVPSAAERGLADHALHIAGGQPLLARVDVVGLDDGTPALIELELIEPSLFFAFSDGGPARLADATLARAGARKARTHV